MAYENLKSAIKQAVKQNGNQEITGNLLQSTLLSMVDNIPEIAQTTGGAEYKTMSQKVISTELAKKADKVDMDVELAKKADKAAVDVELGKKFDKESVVQESGDAEDKVMSQKATSTAIADETTRAKAAEEAISFDVSANNNGAVFESLQALLSSSNLSTLIPTSVRRGGMTIRFIQGSEQSSGNKYVQYRLMSQTFSINESDWQGDTKLLNRIYDLEEKAEEGVIGGYKILEWKTDIATTRKQVPLHERKQGLLISYKNQDGIIVNEQYNEISTQDAFWEMDRCWKKIDYLSVGMLKKLLINENDNYIGVSEIHEDGKYINDKGNLSINSTFAISKAILVKKYTYIVFNNYEYYMDFPTCSYLAKTDESQSTYTSLVRGSERYKVEAYLVTEDMYVAFSFPKYPGLNVEFYSLGYHIKDIYDKLEENTNKLTKIESYGTEPLLINTDGNGIFEVKGNGYIKNGREFTYDNSDFQISKAIFIKKGTIVYAKATQRVYSNNIITETDADYSFYKAIFISTSNKITEYSFIADKDMYIMFGWCSLEEHIFKYALPGELFKNNYYLNNLCLEVALATFSKAIAIGDSVTQGTTVDYPRVYGNDIVQPQYSYTVTTAKILQWDITNAGISGITPTRWYNVMFSKYTYTDYEIAIIELGWNAFDGDFETDVRPFGKNYESYAQTSVGYYCRIVQNIKVLNPNIFIVLVASSGWSTKKVGFIEKVETIAEYFGCGIIVLDRNTIEDLQKDRYHGLNNEGGTIDYIHFTRAGYMMKGIVMAKELNRVLFDNLVKINNERKYVL